MKIYKWIDKYNEKNSRKIILKYNSGLVSGKSKVFSIHPKFYLKYLLRLVLVLSSILTFQRKAYQTAYQLISSQFSPIYPPNKLGAFPNKLLDLVSTLFGYRYFVSTYLLPLLSEKTIRNKKLDFSTFDVPLVSIVVPIFNNLAYTYNCLLSLKTNVSTMVPFEIIIVDDCSTDGTKTFFEINVKGLKYIRNRANQGFLLSSNIGAKAAEGKFICFLNNDTQVRPNWLEELISTFNDEKVGLVGSKLIYANGLLQEAGGVVFNDANAANYGNGQDPDSPLFNYLRKVDYCSGASILIRKADLQKLNYFDERFLPAYYEDTDLCLSVKHLLKKKVVYQPLSEVIHFEGVSSGTNVEKHPVKKFQAINKLKFKEKWRSALINYPEKDDIETALINNRNKRTILIVDDKIPEPDKDSGSLRLSHIIEILLSLDYHVIFVPYDGFKTPGYFEKLGKMGVEVIYRCPNIKAMVKILKTKLHQVDIAWLCKPQNNAKFKFIFEQNHKIKWIYDTIDLHFIREQREAALLKDNVLRERSERTKNQELAFARSANLTIAITIEEKDLLETYELTNVAVVPNVHVSQVSRNPVPFNNREGLIFIGGYAHKPNVDAVIYLVKEIMPKVWDKKPDVKLTLLGSNPTAEVLSLASEKVIVPGYIDDVSAYFNNAKLFVAPLRYGAGMKGKIGQSLSFGLPVITTAIGAEGIDLIDGKDFILAETAKEFAEEILKLYKSEERWTSISEASIMLIKKYHPDKVKKDIEAILAEF